MKIKLLSFCICFASVNMAFGQSDYFKDQLAKAEAGDVMGMLYVANHYRYGSDKDYKKAVEWFEKAANKGNVAAIPIKNRTGFIRAEVHSYLLSWSSGNGCPLYRERTR